MVNAKQIFLLSATLAASMAIAAPVPGPYGSAKSASDLQARVADHADMVYAREMPVQLYKRGKNGRTGKAPAKGGALPEGAVGQTSDRKKQAAKIANNVIEDTTPAPLPLTEEEAARRQKKNAAGRLRKEVDAARVQKKAEEADALAKKQADAKAAAEAEKAIREGKAAEVELEALNIKIAEFNARMKQMDEEFPTLEKEMTDTSERLKTELATAQAAENKEEIKRSQKKLTDFLKQVKTHEKKTADAMLENAELDKKKKDLLSIINQGKKAEEGQAEPAAAAPVRQGTEECEDSTPSKGSGCVIG